MGGWQWGMRVTPFLGALSVMLIALVMYEPKRGEAEKADGATAVVDTLETTYWEDIKAICKMSLCFQSFSETN
ncbi:unnamed protein product [Gongylonema pulchrum]|uniref:MFS domain-containing protein n=1 Tax=Gongylonema pulchrum TaxID=637853 RepID=A0A183DH53_9BILA|nr:unnamed protein product [Gongylonema pulchrum]